MAEVERYGLDRTVDRAGRGSPRRPGVSLPVVRHRRSRPGLRARYRYTRARRLHDAGDVPGGAPPLSRGARGRDGGGRGGSRSRSHLRDRVERESGDPRGADGPCDAQAGPAHAVGAGLGHLRRGDVPASDPWHGPMTGVPAAWPATGP